MIVKRQFRGEQIFKCFCMKGAAPVPAGGIRFSDMPGICAVAENAAFQKFRLERADRISAANSAECDVSGRFAVTEGKIKGVYIAGGAYFFDLGVVNIDIAGAKQRFYFAVFYFKIAGGADVFVFALQMPFA